MATGVVTPEVTEEVEVAGLDVALEALLVLALNVELAELAELEADAELAELEADTELAELLSNETVLETLEAEDEAEALEAEGLERGALGDSEEVARTLPDQAAAQYRARRIDVSLGAIVVV